MRAGEELPLAALEKFLLRYFPASTGPLTAEQFPSGHSNLTYLVRFGHREMILRRPPFGSKVKSAHDMGREYRVLSKLHSAYPQAPKVLLFCDDDSIVGSPFYLTEPIRGIILRKDPPDGLNFSPEVAQRLSESFVDNLAHLQSLDYRAIGLGDLGKPQGYLERQVRGWIDRYRGSQTHDIPEVQRIAAWLIEHMTIGDPLSDLGTALAYWVDAKDSNDLQQVRWCPSNYPGSLTRVQLVEKYALATGRDVSSMAFYLAFARFKVAVILQQIYYRYHLGLTQDQRFASLPRKIETLLQASLRAAETGAI